MKEIFKNSPPRHQGTKKEFGFTKTKAKKILLGALIGALFLPVHLNAQSYKKKGPVGIGGWVIFWDEGNKSLAAFEKHADQIDRAYFEWYHLTPEGMPEPVTQASPELKARAMAAAVKNNVETWYMIGNWDNAINDHNKAWVEKFLYDGNLRAKHIQALINFAKQDKVKGIQIDYENLLAKDKDAFSGFMNELDKAAKAEGLYVGIALPAKTDASGTWDDPQSRDYAAIGKAADEFVPMTYDLHWATSTAGCVTSPEWAEMCIHYAVSVMNPDKLEVGYPAYGYDWVGNHGDSITWQQFQDLMTKYKVKPFRDTDYSQELKINYTDEKGQQHEAWIPDSRCLEYQADIVKRYKLYGLGVWYFGSEDESFWTTMKKVNATTQETSKLLPADTLVAAAPKPSTLEFLTDAVGADYAYAYPEGQSKITVVEKSGKRWVDAALKGNEWSGFGAGTSRKNLEPYREKGALQFYVRGAKGGESQITFGFLMDTGLGSDEKVHYQSAVTISNYTNITTKWQLVTIPLADFPATGGHFDENIGSRVYGTFKWNKVMEWGCDVAPGSDPVCEIFMSSVRVVPTYDVKAVERAKFQALSK